MTSPRPIEVGCLVMFVRVGTAYNERDRRLQQAVLGCVAQVTAQDGPGYWKVSSESLRRVKQQLWPSPTGRSLSPFLRRVPSRVLLRIDDPDLLHDEPVEVNLSNSLKAPV